MSMRRTMLAGVALAGVLAGCGGHTGDPSSSGATRPVAVAASARARAPVPVTLVARPAVALGAGIQDASAVPWRGGALLIGGLTPADVSSSAIVLARTTGSVRSGKPSPGAP